MWTVESQPLHDRAGGLEPKDNNLIAVRVQSSQHDYKPFSWPPVPPFSPLSPHPFFQSLACTFGTLPLLFTSCGGLSLYILWTFSCSSVSSSNFTSSRKPRSLCYSHSLLLQKSLAQKFSLSLKLLVVGIYFRVCVCFRAVLLTLHSQIKYFHTTKAQIKYSMYTGIPQRYCKFGSRLPQ